jgi:hypothetical protein
MRRRIWRYQHGAVHATLRERATAAGFRGAWRGRSLTSPTHPPESRAILVDIIKFDQARQRLLQVPLPQSPCLEIGQTFSACLFLL